MAAFTNWANGSPRGNIAPPSPAHLTTRELLVLQLMARGYSIEQIARLVGESPASILERAATVEASLGATDGCGAVAVALRCGLII